MKGLMRASPNARELFGGFALSCLPAKHPHQRSVTLKQDLKCCRLQADMQALMQASPKVRELLGGFVLSCSTASPTMKGAGKIEVPQSKSRDKWFDIVCIFSCSVREASKDQWSIRWCKSAQVNALHVRLRTAITEQAKTQNLC